MTYRSTKTYGANLGLSCAFRQWRAESHCRFLHGYALVVDFGSLKSFKGWLENTFDHCTLVASDDPEYETFKALDASGIIDMRTVEVTGCEAFARMIFECADIWLKDNGYSPRVWIAQVEVREHGSNSAIYSL